MRIELTPGFVAFVLIVYLLAGELVWPLLLAAAMHELAHLAVLGTCGVRVRSLTLRFADAEIDAAPAGYLAEIVCALAGPAANFICCGLFRLRAPDFAALHLLLGCYNLLPVLPLDGGRALRAALSLLIWPELAQRVCAAAGAVVCLALILAAGYAAVCRQAGIWPLAAALTVTLRLAELRLGEKQVAFPAAAG